MLELLNQLDGFDAMSDVKVSAAVNQYLVHCLREAFADAAGVLPHMHFRCNLYGGSLPF